MGVSKGFIHTLEAIIASSLVLGVVLFVFPQVNNESGIRTGDLRQKMDRIDQRDNLSHNSSEIETQLEDRLSTGYNVSVRQVNNSVVVSSDIDGNESFSLDNGGYKDIMLWIDSNSGFSADFQNSTIIDSYSKNGYLHRSVSGSGSLNFSGTVEAHLEAVEYPGWGSISTKNQEVFTVNYVTDDGNNTREVKARIWQ
ncbi:MAG: hypothetical protein ABEJ56_05160 [Candidatus Nanohaloarchaea archaeon]